MQQAGRTAAFLSAGGYHHHVALNTWQSLGGSSPPAGSTGLFHVAFRYPARAALAKAVKRVLDHGVQITGASDHGVSEAVYLRDPDDNGVELYYDRPKDEWPRPADGNGVAMFSEPLDVDALVADAGLSSRSLRPPAARCRLRDGLDRVRRRSGRRGRTSCFSDLSQELLDVCREIAGERGATLYLWAVA